MTDFHPELSPQVRAILARDERRAAEQEEHERAEREAAAARERARAERERKRREQEQTRRSVEYPKEVFARLEHVEARLDSLLNSLVNMSWQEELSAELDRRGVMTYRGTYETGTEYERGSVVTRSGAAWYCVFPTSDVPGKSPNWRLMTKACT